MEELETLKCNLRNLKTTKTKEHRQTKKNIKPGKKVHWKLNEWFSGRFGNLKKKNSTLKERSEKVFRIKHRDQKAGNTAEG